MLCIELQSEQTGTENNTTHDLRSQMYEYYGSWIQLTVDTLCTQYLIISYLQLV